MYWKLGNFPKLQKNKNKTKNKKKYKNFKSLGFLGVSQPPRPHSGSASPLAGVHGNKQGSDEKSPYLISCKDPNLEIKASTTCELQQNIVRWMENKNGIDLIVLESCSGEDAG